MCMTLVRVYLCAASLYIHVCLWYIVLCVTVSGESVCLYVSWIESFL